MSTYAGIIQEFHVADPPAGSDQIFTIPDGYWQVLSVYFKFICSSAVASRQTGLTVRSQPTTIPIVSQYVASLLTASQLGLHSFGSGMAIQALNSSGLIKTLGSFPSPLILKTGDTIETVTDNMQSGDTITLFQIRLRSIVPSQL